MIWKGLMVLTNCAKPIIIVLRSDWPYTFYDHGDLLVLTNYDAEPIRAGDIVVFEVVGRNIPIPHRVIRVHEKNDGYIKLLTKGDASMVDGRGLYPSEQLWLERKDIIGKVKGYIPYIGMMIIVINNLFQVNLPVSVLIGCFVLMCRRWNTMIFEYLDILYN